MKSLRTRLTFTHTLVALLALLLVGVLSTILIRAGFQRVARQQEAQQIATRIATAYDARSGQIDIATILRRRPGLALVGEFFLIANDQMVVIFPVAQAGNRLQANLMTRAEPITTESGHVLGYVAPRPDRVQQLGRIQLDFLTRVYLSVACSSVLGVLLALLIGRFIAGRLATPVRSLTVAARSLASSRYHGPIAVTTDDEIGELTRAFNTMSDELAHQEQLRRQLVADIAHELRTPLSVLRLQVESLQDGVEQPTPATLESLGEEVGLLTRLVDDLRLLSLADAGQLSLSPVDLDPRAELERAAASALPRARQQGIDLRVEASDLLPPIHADPQRLAQVLGNLVENALRYTPSGGHVTLRAYQQTVAHDAQTLVIEIADTGPGIAPDDLTRIFERFYRTDRARARETGGSGLGLAIVQRLVEAQGGAISVESTPGEGTTFRVRFPLAVAVVVHR